MVDVGRVGKLRSLGARPQGVPDEQARHRRADGGSLPGGRFPLGGGMILKGRRWRLTVRGSTRTPMSAWGSARLARHRRVDRSEHGQHVHPPGEGRGALRPRDHWPGDRRPRKTVFVKSGQIKSVTARCPGKTVLVSGGFQRTNSGPRGGTTVTESRAVGPKAWRVTGTGFGLFGGELTAMAYCVRHKGPILTEVSESAAIRPDRRRPRRRRPVRRAGG